MSKRTASGAAGSHHAKKAKADPIVSKMEQVVSALDSANLTTSILKMITDVIPQCLGVVREERHRFQEEAVEMIGVELTKIEADLEKKIESAKASKDVLAEQLGVQAGGLTKLQESLEEQKQELQKRKVALADAARLFQKTKNQCATRKAQQEIGLAEVKKSEADKTKIDVLAAEVDEVHKHEDANACAKFIKELSKLVEVDDSMKTAIPPALAKAPDARGGFDAMVVQQLNAAIAKQLEELSSKIANAEPMKAALEKDIAEAEAAHLTNKDTQMHAAKGYVEIQDTVTAEEAKVKALQKEMNSLKRQDKKGADALSEAQYQLDLFKEGPLTAFTFLKDRAAEKADEEVLADVAESAAAAPVAVAAC